MSPRLPPELTDRIIDYVCYNEEALCACSLVCRSWLPSCRFHCFLIITSANVHPFVELLDSPLSTIAKHAPYLVIQSSPEEPIHVLDVLAPYLESFPTTIFGLSSWGWSPRRELGEGVQKFCSRLSDVTINSYFTSSHQFIGFLTSLHSLEKLTICPDKFTFPTNITNPITLSSSLHTIRFSVSPTVPKLPWLLSTLQFPSVTSLFVYKIGAEVDYPAIQHLLRLLGPSLQTVHLEFVRQPMEMFSDYVDLECNTNLRSLFVAGFLLDSCYDGVLKSRRSFIDIFSRITSFALTEVTLWFSGHEAYVVDLPWKELNNALSRAQFASLQKVQIQILYFLHAPIPPDIIKGWNDTIHKGMPCLRDRGILDVDVTLIRIIIPPNPS